MTPSVQTSPVSSSIVARAGRKLATATAARRGRALLKLADRHGEVRVQVRGAGGVDPGSADMVDLLDALNETGLLRYGGLQRTGSDVELVYHRA